jgi:hypothetical protein
MKNGMFLYCLLATHLTYDPEDGSSSFLRNGYKILPDYGVIGIPETIQM